MSLHQPEVSLFEESRLASNTRRNEMNALSRDSFSAQGSEWIFLEIWLWLYPNDQTLFNSDAVQLVDENLSGFWFISYDILCSLRALESNPLTKQQSAVLSLLCFLFLKTRFTADLQAFCIFLVETCSTTMPAGKRIIMVHEDQCSRDINLFSLERCRIEFRLVRKKNSKQYKYINILTAIALRPKFCAEFRVLVTATHAHFL